VGIFGSTLPIDDLAANKNSVGGNTSPASSAPAATAVNSPMRRDLLQVGAGLAVAASGGSATASIWSFGPEGAFTTGVCSIGWQLGARMLEKTDTKQGARFRKGQSGNPSGRPPGARNKTTLAAEALLDGEAEALTRKAIERALEGDTTALRLFFRDDISRCDSLSALHCQPRRHASGNGSYRRPLATGMGPAPRLR
jgi:hypothetical protein